ncbi:hypothetical protein ISP15_09015 [Dyella jejuensis]|uniref:Uncharacterized protein n=1 Tax=Dyella jejuensis TaxID=1432009 RepID=A0ABW8JJL3_9GAMM
MPSNTCHPNAPHTKLKAPDWFISSLMMDRALDAILRRVKKLDREHDIPYLAGYSQDGKTIYIDRHLPRSFTFRGRTIDVDRFLILHEEVEKTLIDQLGLHYLHAHQIATRAEEAAVHAQRITWQAYDRFMQKYVKTIGDERLCKVPADLDLKPYRDYHDYDLLRQMEQHLERGAGATARQKTELKNYAAAFREQLRVQHRHELHSDDAGRRRKPAAKKSAVAKTVKTGKGTVRRRAATKPAK